MKELRQAARACEQELHIVAALDRALEDPLRVFALVVNDDNVEEASASIREEFSLDEVQATAVLDLQWRQAPRAAREKVRTAREVLTRTLKELEDSLADRA